MAYKPRVEVPGAYYHVVTRGNNKRSIADNDGDFELFRLILIATARAYDWTIVTFVLMGNHYHLVIKLGAVDKGLSRGMCFLNTAYATEYNDRRGRINHLFGRRYWSKLLPDDAALLQACRYVILNPVRAGICERPEDYAWTSYRMTLGLEPRIPRFDDRVLLEQISLDTERARRGFRAFVEAALEHPAPYRPATRRSIVPEGHVRRQPP